MIVVDPVTLGDTSLSGGGGSYYDKNGVLQTAAPGTPRLTYDPADLSKPPALMLEPAATNLARVSEMYDDAWFGKSRVTVQANAATAPDGTVTADKIIADATMAAHYVDQSITGNYSDGQRFAFSVFARAGEVGKIRLDMYYAIGSGGGSKVIFDLVTGAVVSKDNDVESARIEKLPGGWYRCIMVGVVQYASTYSTQFIARTVLISPSNVSTWTGDGTGGAFLWGLHIEAVAAGGTVTSYIKTAGQPVTRAADVVGSTPGLLYSNVAETEQVWVAGTTYAKDAVVRVGHTVYQSLVASNVGNDPTLAANVSKWLKLGATNRFAMFDDRNNTQTKSPEEIVVVLSPRAIAQGLLLGNTDATEIGVSVTVPNYGVVYSEISSMVVSTSRSSFFRWAFNRIKRRSLFLTLKLPLFFNGVVTVTIRRPGGVAKCGMCMIGPTVNNGLTLMGLSTEIKDYSTTLFNTDGSSETTPRGYRKLMSMDVSIDTEDIVEAEEQMIAWRQKNVVWIGSPARLDTVAVGRYSSFKKVIESYPRSKMALQIEGVLS